MKAKSTCNRLKKELRKQWNNMEDREKQVYRDLAVNATDVFKKRKKDMA